MAIDFGKLVYEPSFNVFGRPVTFTPAASQPGHVAYTGRGIYSTQPVDVLTENNAILSDAMTILDILEAEFSVLPVQGDTISIPAYLTLPALGAFEIIETKSNGGGETTLSIRKIMEAKP